MEPKEIAAGIPDYTRFLTVDELNASTRQLAQTFPELVSTRVVGTTSQGDPLTLITIGDGPRQAFVFGAPDPDEPVGCLMIEYLAHRLCIDETLRQSAGFTWHFIKAIEADGLRRNEGWFGGPFTVGQYARHMYRGWITDKADFNFPIQYKRFNFDSDLPEMKALMSVIDETRPDFMYALHNGKFGGVWYSLSHPYEPLYEPLAALPGWFDLQLNLGETEGGAEPVAPAVYCSQQSFSQWYDAVEEKGLDPVSLRAWGLSSREYARRYDTFSLVTEVPYWNAPQANDLSPTDIPFGKAMLGGIKSMAAHFDWAEGVLAPVQAELRLASPLRSFVEKFMSISRERHPRQMKWAQNAPEASRPATQAELFSHGSQLLFIRMVYAGMIARLMVDEIESGNPSPALPPARDAARAKLSELEQQLEADVAYTTISIRDMVGVQLCAGLAAAAYLRGSR